jgi:hypothetical protein
MGIIKRNFLSSFVAITIALFTVNTDGAQLRGGPHRPSGREIHGYNLQPSESRSLHQSEFKLDPSGPVSLQGLSEPSSHWFKQDSSGLISLTSKNQSSATRLKPNDSPVKLKTDALDLNTLRSLRTTENWGQGPDPAWGSVNPHSYSYARELQRLLEAERGPYWRIAE